jgi:hypothetical protein
MGTRSGVGNGDFSESSSGLVGLDCSVGAQNTTMAVAGIRTETDVAGDEKRRECLPNGTRSDHGGAIVGVR